MIKACFVDDRLLHGQIAFKWSNYYLLDTIVVINDDAANDEFTKTILELAKPRNVELSVRAFNEETLSYINVLHKKDTNCLIIVGNLFDALTLIEKVAFINRINVTGLREKLNSRYLNERVSLSFEDINAIRKLIGQNIAVTSNLSPDDKYHEFTLQYLNELDR